MNEETQTNQMDEEIQTTTPDLQQMNRKLRYYYRHKDDIQFKARMTEAKARYYQNNKEHLKAKALERYYALKIANEPQNP